MYGRGFVPVYSILSGTFKRSLPMENEFLPYSLIFFNISIYGKLYQSEYFYFIKKKQHKNKTNKSEYSSLFEKYFELKSQTGGCTLSNRPYMLGGQITQCGRVYTGMYKHVL